MECAASCMQCPIRSLWIEGHVEYYMAPEHHDFGEDKPRHASQATIKPQSCPETFSHDSNTQIFLQELNQEICSKQPFQFHAS